MYELTALVSAELFIHFNFPFEQAMAETNMEILLGLIKIRNRPLQDITYKNENYSRQEHPFLGSLSNFHDIVTSGS